MNIQVKQTIVIVAIFIVLLGISRIIPTLFKYLKSKTNIKLLKKVLTEIKSDINRLFLTETIAFLLFSLLVIWVNIPRQIMIRLMLCISYSYAIGISFAFITIGVDECNEFVKNSDMTEKDKTISLTIIPIIGSLLRYFSFGILFAILLKTWGVSIAPIITGSAFILAILGFAGQAIIQDVLGFLSLLIDRPFYVGSEIEWTINENYTERGIVEQITLRNTVIRTNEGYLFYQPNRNASNFRLWRK